jgi:hypothetical protein
MTSVDAREPTPLEGALNADLESIEVLPALTRRALSNTLRNCVYARRVKIATKTLGHISQFVSEARDPLTADQPNANYPHCLRSVFPLLT